MFLELFADREPDTELKPGQILFIEHGKADYAYIVHTGHVELSIRGCELTTVGPGEILGEMALVDDQKRSAMAVAGSEGAKLYSLSKEKFLDMLGANPDFALKVMKIMADRLRKWGELFQ